MQQQPRPSLPLWFLIANWLLILAAFALGAYLGDRRLHRLPEPQRSTLAIVFDEVLKSHIEPPDEHELLERAISGMVDGLDAYSRYIPPREVPRYEETTSGTYQGIGAKIVTHGEQVVVHFPFPGGPAAKAGLLPGDRVLAVDGNALDDADTRAHVVELVRGEQGTPVRLRIRRGDEEREIEVRRGSVLRPCVKWGRYVDPARGLGYLHLTGFHPTAAREVTAEIEDLERRGELRGLVFDLRFNGGGSLDQCLAIANLFLREGVIATQLHRNAPNEVYRADPAQCRWPDLPLVLLVNEGSASASEVLSGALQDHGRATVVGRRTHGKGYVNTVYSWADRGFKLKLTTGSYRTPNGRNIERNQSTVGTPADREHGGILPDVDVPIEPAAMAAVRAALRAIEPPAEYLAGYSEVAERFGFAVERGPEPDDDEQLRAAIEALAGD